MFCNILAHLWGQSRPPAHLFQGLHKLFYWDGPAQQRLQHFAVRNVLAHPLPLLTAGGLGGLGRGLGQREGMALSEHLFTDSVAMTCWPGVRTRLSSWVPPELMQPYAWDHICLTAGTRFAFPGIPLLANEISSNSHWQSQPCMLQCLAGKPRPCYQVVVEKH